MNLFVCGFYYVWGCDESGETLGKALQHCIQTYFFCCQGERRFDLDVFVKAGPDN